MLFRKEYAEAKYCQKCKPSRFMEVDSGEWTEEAARHPRDNPTPPSVHTEDLTSIHDRGIHEIDDIAQKWQTIQS
jgi:hypothetical protein